MVLETTEAVTNDFYYVFEEFRKDGPINGPLKFILFLADKDPETKISWSDECNEAEPAIIQRFEAADIDIALLKVYIDKVGWSREWHLFKMDRRFSLKVVPTLIRWEFGGITGRLVDKEACDVSKIDALLSSN